jgi:hypothetical protein
MSSTSTTTTTTTTTTHKPSTTLDEFFDIIGSTTPPTETVDQTWLSWFIKQFSYIKTATSYLTVSWRFPSIYDIVLGIISFSHSITLIVFCACCQRRNNRKPAVKKFEWSKMFKRRSNPVRRPRVNKEDIESTPQSGEEDAEAIPMIVTEPSAKTVKMVTYEEQENKPKSAMKKSKRTAPVPPSAPFEEISYGTYTQPRGGGGGQSSGQGRVRGYLRTSIPVYLMNSDITLNQNY